MEDKLQRLSIGKYEGFLTKKGRIFFVLVKCLSFHWQLFEEIGNNDSLQPTQRFWNLKQLASFPPNIAAIPVAVNNTNITCAAQADVNKNIYVVHLVNNSAERMITIKGLPASVKKLSVYVTSKTKNMQEEKPVAVLKGEAKFLLNAVSYTTVAAE